MEGMDAIRLFKSFELIKIFQHVADFQKMLHH